SPGVTAMGNYLSGPGFVRFLLGLASVLALAGLAAPHLRRRSQRLRRNTEIFWFSSLHFFSKELSECRDPQQMVDQSLRGALEMLDMQEGYLLVHEEGDEGKVHCGIRGISAQGVERLSGDTLR